MSERKREEPQVGDWQVPPRGAFVIRPPQKSKRDHSHAKSVADKEQAERVARQKAASELNKEFYQAGGDWQMPRRAS